LDDEQFAEVVEELDYIIQHTQNVMLGAMRKVCIDMGFLKEN